MVSRRRVTRGLLLFGASPLLVPLGKKVAAQEGSSSGDEVVALLNGTEPVDARGLAEIARQRTVLATAWLKEAQRPIGVFYYIYDPERDEYEIEEYNEVRHAGTTYSLFQAYGLLGEDSVLTTAEGAAGYILNSTVPVRAAGRAYLDIQNGDTSLGGQALALVALLERRRVTGNTDADGLINQMAEFLLWMEVEDHQGRFYMSYKPGTGSKLPTPDVVYYPGETLLALTRLAQQFPGGPYIEVAKRAANYLVHERDGDIPKTRDIGREDHWLTIALAELYRLDKDKDFAKVAYLQSEAMIANQYTDEDGKPDTIGGARRDGPISNSSTATKGEAIVAAWALATFKRDDKAAARFALGAQRNAQFQMRVQYTEQNTGDFARPDLTIGGWPGSVDNPSIRIDYVQHNMSVLVGLCHMTVEGDLPIATPLPGVE